LSGPELRGGSREWWKVGKIQEVVGGGKENKLKEGKTHNN
jgi:hypothetical protein